MPRRPSVEDTGLSNRIKMVVALFDSHQDAARVAGLSTSQLYLYTSGKSSAMSFQPLRKLCAATGIRLDWLSTGDGPMYIADRTGQSDGNFAAGGLEKRFGSLLDLFPSRDDAAQQCGTSSKQLWRYATGRTAVPLDVVRLACSKQGVSADWLLFGNGPMYLQDRAGHNPPPQSGKPVRTDDFFSTVSELGREIDGLSGVLREKLGSEVDGLIRVLAALGFIGERELSLIRDVLVSLQAK